MKRLLMLSLAYVVLSVLANPRDSIIVVQVFEQYEIYDKGFTNLQFNKSNLDVSGKCINSNFVK